MHLLWFLLFLFVFSWSCCWTCLVRIASTEIQHVWANIAIHSALSYCNMQLCQDEIHQPLEISATQAVKWDATSHRNDHPKTIYSAPWPRLVVSTSFSFSKTSWWFPVLTRLFFKMEFSLKHQLMRNLGLYQGPILWAYWHQSFSTTGWWGLIGVNEESQGISPPKIDGK